MAAHRRLHLLDTGSRAPAFRLDRLDGGAVSLQELLSAGPVLLVFFKVTCPVCQLALPFLNRIHSAGALTIFGVSQNDAEDTLDFNREYGITFPVLLDSEDGGFAVSNAFGISSVPTLFMVGSDGVISNVIEGWSKKDIELLGAGAGVAVFRQGDHVPEWKAG